MSHKKLLKGLLDFRFCFYIVHKQYFIQSRGKSKHKI